MEKDCVSVLFVPSFYINLNKERLLNRKKEVRGDRDKSESVPTVPSTKKSVVNFRILAFIK